MRLFLIYAIVELAVIVALASTIGFGWTVLALLGAFVLGFALAGSQVKRHIRRLQSGLRRPRRARSPTARSSRWAPCWSFIPGLVTIGCGPAAAAAADPGRRPSRLDSRGRHGGCRWSPSRPPRRARPAAGHGDYIDGEVIDVVDVEPDVVAVERNALPPQDRLT